MMSLWSPHSHAPEPDGGAWRLVNYMIARRVSKKIGSRVVRIERSPAPEVLRGDPDLVRRAIAALPYKHRYSAVTLSFAEHDIPVPAFNVAGPARDRAGRILELFFETAYPGIEPEARPPILASTHVHMGRVEINIALPRAVLRPDGQLRSYNPHPKRRKSAELWQGHCQVILAPSELGELLSGQASQVPISAAYPSQRLTASARAWR